MKTHTILEVIQKTREYLDYVEEHILNVQKAWKHVCEKCKDMRFVWNDYYYHTIDAEVEIHDLSKLSEEEFTQYRRAFYPTDFEKTSGRYELGSAWEHHKENNPHHWENWTTDNHFQPNGWEIHCVHMVLDWMAMGYKFGDTAQDFYEKNKDKIVLPDYAVDFIYEIFKRI